MSDGVVWKKLPQGGCKGNQTFLRGAAPKESLMTRGTSHGQNFQTIPKDFPLFFRLLDKNSEDYVAQSCPTINSELILVNLGKV